MTEMWKISDDNFILKGRDIKALVPRTLTTILIMFF